MAGNVMTLLEKGSPFKNLFLDVWVFKGALKGCTQQFCHLTPPNFKMLAWAEGVLEDSMEWNGNHKSLQSLRHLFHFLNSFPNQKKAELSSPDQL